MHFKISQNGNIGSGSSVKCKNAVQANRLREYENIICLFLRENKSLKNPHEINL